MREYILFKLLFYRWGNCIEGYIEQECERVRCRKGACIGRNRALGLFKGNMMLMMMMIFYMALQFPLLHDLLSKKEEI